MSGRRVNLLIAIVVAASAVAFVAFHWPADNPLDLFAERGRPPMPEPQSVPTSYGACAKAEDPPICLVEELSRTGWSDDESFLYTAIAAGAVDVAADLSFVMIDAAQGRGTTNRMEFVIAGKRFPRREQLLGARGDVVEAAILLAAAASVADDPFANAHVADAVTRAGDAGAVAQIAQTLWEKADLRRSWRAEVSRPHGMLAIWRATAAHPPRDTELLIDFASEAAYWGAQAEERTLWREVLKRSDITAAQRLRAEREVAGRSPRPIGPQEETAARREIVATCMEVLPQNGYQAGRCEVDLAFLAQLGGIAELIQIGDAYLRRARESKDISTYRTAWYGLASEAYRLAGKKDKALATAREGLPLVPLAVQTRWHGMSAPRLDTPEGRLSAAGASDGATEPVIQLYRAGARDEALRTGFLSGYHRYKNATVAGETPDARWIVADHDTFAVERLLDDLLREPDAATAWVFHNALACEGPSFYAPFPAVGVERTLGVIAALAGQRSVMAAHMARAAGALDREDTMLYRMQLAQSLAEEWRRALVIAERVPASDAAPVRCSKAQQGRAGAKKEAPARGPGLK